MRYVLCLKKCLGEWASESVECLSLGFGLGHGFAVHGFKPHFGLCAGSVEPAWDFLSPLSASPLLPLPFSQNK